MKREHYIMCSHLQHAWNRAAQERLDQHISVNRERLVFEIVLACDPTAQGRYGAWLSAWRRKQWPDFGLRCVCSSQELQDLARGIEHFDRVRSRLPLDYRDIGRFRDAAELIVAEQFAHACGRREARALERDQAYSESLTLFHEGRWRLVKLNSKQSAQWWGKGTQWCTAGQFFNRYEQYASKGSLLIMLTPSGKYQLSLHSMEFRDATDARSHLPTVTRHAPAPLRQLLVELGCSMAL